MANTTSLRSLHHHPLLRTHNSSSDASTTSTLPSSLFLKPTTTPSPFLSHKFSTSTHFILSSSSTATPIPTLSFDILQQHLASKDFRQADEETRRLLIILAGEAAQKRGYVFFSEVKFISKSNLQIIDELWQQYSNNKFGYSVQKRIWEKSRRDFTKFFMNVGWMKKLDTEVVQYNYRSFPTEFIWELNEDTPEGHLPLTNALRGTQLLNSILTHPAFQHLDEEGNDAAEDKGGQVGLEELRQSSKPFSKKEFKPDYSF